MRHSVFRRCSMPMLFIGLKPDDVALVHFFNLTTLPLHPATTCSNNQCLTKWMSMPGSPGARFKRNAGGRGTPGIIGRKQRINPNSSCEPIFRSFGRRLRSYSCNFHEECFCL